MTEPSLTPEPSAIVDAFRTDMREYCEQKNLDAETRRLFDAGFDAFGEKLAECVSDLLRMCSRELLAASAGAEKDRARAVEVARGAEEWDERTKAWIAAGKAEGFGKGTELGAEMLSFLATQLWEARG